MKIISLVLGAVILSILQGCAQSCESSTCLIPNGYTGKIRVDYSISGASSLPEENGRFLVRIPTTGRLKTSTKLPEGWHDPELFYWVSGQTRTRLFTGGEPFRTGEHPHNKAMVHGGSVGKTNESPPSEFWFIGTDKQYKAYQQRGGDDGSN